MDDAQAWLTEERFWTGGEQYWEGRVDPHCLMILPQPAGVLGRDEALAGIRAAPRWNSVRLEERRLSRPAGDLILLAYRARARREGSPDYAALCGSAYRRDGAEWLLVFHQQARL